MEKGHYEFIIHERIRQYKNDINCCIADLHDDNKERIRQDKVIIQELNKILTGKELWVLSYEN